MEASKSTWQREVLYNLLKKGEIDIHEKRFTGFEKYTKKVIEGVKRGKKERVLMFNIAGIPEEPSKNIFQLVIERNREEREYEGKVCKELSFFQNQDLTKQY